MKLRRDPLLARPPAATKVQSREMGGPSPVEMINHLSGEWAMTSFESIHQGEILGSLTMFDRMIFKGHLTEFFPRGAFGR